MPDRAAPLVALLVVVAIAGCGGDGGGVSAQRAPTSKAASTAGTNTGSPGTSPSSTASITTATTRVIATTTIDRCRQPAGPRPETGTELRDRVRSGGAVLSVDNGTNLDAIVKVLTLDDPPTAVAAVYVRAKEQLEISRLPRGTLRLAFAQGSHWDEGSSTFLCRQVAQAFEEDFDFSDGDWEVTLNAIPGGTAKTDSLDPRAFNSY
ncbi:MAG: hypothetical protein LC799_03975 [Actinobacteria bacterium]|nr:hypothetical protein [Actinomycetota bacterium]